MKHLLSILLSICILMTAITALPLSIYAQEADLAATGETEGDFMYIIYEGEVTVIRYIGSAAELIIPSALGGSPVTGIGNSALNGCASLKSVTIPDSVTEIRWDAFRDCDSLERVTIGNSVAEIWLNAFHGCASLESVIIPNSVTLIGDSAFYSCAALKSVTIPESVTGIGSHAFGYDLDEDQNHCKIEGFTIKGCKNTEAERYANDNGFAFIALDEQPTEILLGDADGDGAITVLDATRIQKYVARLCNLDGALFNGAEPTERERMTADVDKDDVISILDSDRIQKYKAHLCSLDGTVPYHD